MGSLVIDFSSEIDKIIADFPNNATLQYSLGLGEDVLLNPYKSIFEVPFNYDMDKLTGLVRYLAGCRLENGDISKEDAVIFKELQEFLVLANRYIVAKMILTSNYNIGIPKDIFRIYFEVAKKSVENQIDSHLKRVSNQIGRRMEEEQKLTKLFG